MIVISKTSLLVKEALLVVLAFFSVGLGLYEMLGTPSDSQVKFIDSADIIIALIFLVDFLIMLNLAKNRSLFWKHNWYLLLACIPIYSSWAAILRGVRILAVFRVLRAAEHLNYSINGRK